MKTVIVVDFHQGVQRSTSVKAISQLTSGRVYIHFHDPTKYRTPFYRWIVQVKKRHGLPHLRSSCFQMMNGALQDGKQDRSKLRNPAGYYTIWHP